MNELVIVIIALIISVISSIIKANKKAKENPSKGFLSDPWGDTVMKEDVIKPSRSSIYPHDTTLDENTEVVETKIIQRGRIDAMICRYENNNIAPNLSNKDVKIGSTEEVQSNQVMQKFNLVDAVIYSEILKPKF